MKTPITQNLEPNNLNKLIVYADGGARGNPGPAAVGVVIKSSDGKTVKEYGETLEGMRTNNEAEYEAVILALKKIKQFLGKEKTRELEIEFRLDSELVASQLGGKFRVDEERLQLLYMQVHNLKFDFKKIIFKTVPREKNARADQLLNRALDADKERLF